MSSKQSIITRIIIIALIVITAASIIVGCNANNDIDSNTSNPTESTANSTERVTSPVSDETTDAGTNADSNDPTISTTNPTEETAAPTVSNQGETDESDPNNGNDENADNTETGDNQNETTKPTSPDDGSEDEKPNDSVTYTEVNETVYATSTVNVRNGAGTSYERLGSLSKGESVTRIGIGSNGWSKVIYDGKEAFVSSSYLSTTKPMDENPGNKDESKPTEPNLTEGESKPTEPVMNWSTAPGTRPYEYQEVFSILDFERCGIYQHCDRYGNVWIDRSPSSNGYGKTIYSNWLFNSDLHYYGDGIWSNFGAWWSEDGSRSGGSFSMTLGAATFPDIGSGEYVAPYGPQETVSSYIQACANALVGYETIMSNETWSDEQKANEVAAYFAAMGVKEADVIGYRDNPTTHPFPGVG